MYTVFVLLIKSRISFVETIPGFLSNKSVKTGDGVTGRAREKLL